MVKNFRSKKMVPLLALLLFVAGSVPAWSAEEGQTETSAATEAAGGSEAATPEQAAVEQAPAPPAPEAVISEPPPGDVSAATQAGSEQTAGADNGEILQESFNPVNWLVYKPLWYLTSLIGDFNPVGKYVSTPLEEKFPGLRVKGFVNSITQINTTANNTTGLGARDKDWLLQKQEIRTQLEVKYQANENIELVSVNNFLYDGAYDLQDSKGLYLDGSSNQKLYDQGKRIFREEYVRGNYGKLNFTLGKQIVNWGKMDGKVIDIINGADIRDVVDFHNGDYEWRAMGQWMANLSVRPTETTTVSFVLNPDFQPNVGPAGGSPYWFPWAGSPKPNSGTAPETRPRGFNHVQDLEEGVRVDQTIGALVVSGIYYYGFDRDPVHFSSDNLNHYTRINRYGYALDYATNILSQRLIIRSEGLYTQGMAFNTSDPNAPNGIVKRDSLKLALAFETSIFSDENKIDILYQPVYTKLVGGYDKRISGKLTTPTYRDDLLHVINISHSVRKTNDRLTLSATAYIEGGTVYQGLSYNLSAGWRFNDFLKATLAFNDYQRKDDEIAWGAYSKWKNVTLDVKYEF